MIDTDKYEGYTKGKWTWLFNDEVPIHLLCVSEGVIGIGVTPEDNVSEADMRLIADAPLLLAEVKRLNALVHNDYNWLKLNHPKVFDEMMMSKLFGDEEE